MNLTRYLHELDSRNMARNQRRAFLGVKSVMKLPEG